MGAGLVWGLSERNSNRPDRCQFGLEPGASRWRLVLYRRVSAFGVSPRLYTVGSQRLLGFSGGQAVIMLYAFTRCQRSCELRFEEGGTRRRRKPSSNQSGK